MFTIGDILRHKQQRIERAKNSTSLSEDAAFLLSHTPDAGMIYAIEHPDEKRLWCPVHQTLETWHDYVSHCQDCGRVNH